LKVPPFTLILIEDCGLVHVIVPIEETKISGFSLFSVTSTSFVVLHPFVLSVTTTT